MNISENGLQAHTDDQGHIILPPEVAAAYRIKPGLSFRLQVNPNSLEIQRPVNQLSKLYVEVTNRCNLGCRTCMRNSWQEPLGNMSDAVFSRIIEGLRLFSPPPTFFFGGFGEPLLHPHIIDMILEAKKLGCRVELITNGTLLSQEISQGLVETGIDLVWVSIDGATPASYSDIRLGSALPKVLENLAYLNKLILSGGRISGSTTTRQYPTKLGLAFVAMKRNISDLPAMIKLGKSLNVERFIVTNVLPYTAEMCEETLYNTVLDEMDHSELLMPRIDSGRVSLDPLYRSVRYLNWVDNSSGCSGNQCPFITQGAATISWNGGFSPCLPLLHSNISYVMGRRRSSRGWVVGNLQEQTLESLWNSPEHLKFRERVRDFSFSPCTKCGSCDFSEKNEEDCFGNAFPACGGCLWAQGIIQCP